MPKSLRSKDVLNAAKDAGLNVRRTGSRLIVTDNRAHRPGSDEPNPTRGEMLSTSAHPNETYDKGKAAAIRKWFARLGITILVIILFSLYILWA